MKFQAGEILVAHNGHQYRVIESRDNAVSLMRLNGYTLFSCKLPFVESMFRPVNSLKL
jgi:hypothetical protein